MSARRSVPMRSIVPPPPHTPPPCYLELSHYICFEKISEFYLVFIPVQNSGGFKPTGVKTAFSPPSISSRKQIWQLLTCNEDPPKTGALAWHLRADLPLKGHRHSRWLEEAPLKGAKNPSLPQNSEKPALPSLTFPDSVCIPEFGFRPIQRHLHSNPGPEIFVRKSLWFPSSFFLVYPNRTFPLQISDCHRYTEFRRRR
jgi:hypothetical protein